MHALETLRGRVACLVLPLLLAGPLGAQLVQGKSQLLPTPDGDHPKSTFAPASPSSSGTRAEERPPYPPYPGLDWRSGGIGVQHGRGEFQLVETDLVLPGRGFDFRWTRTYRSNAPQPLDSSQGVGWDHAYNIYVEATGKDLISHEGRGRADVFERTPDGTWVRHGDAHAIRRNPDGTFIYEWPHGEEWHLYALDGSPREGRVSSIVDRTGNTMSFQYDGLGRLTTVTDTVGRTIGLTYTPGGRVATVSALGRTWLYAYYGNGDPDGSPGDLKSVRTPIVSGTPNGNDFLAGKTTVYTYSKHADPKLAHNLLTVTSPSGTTWLENQYSATTDPGALQYDRIVRQSLGSGNPPFLYSYRDASVAKGETLSVNGKRTEVVVNDPRGIVTHLLYDGWNRLIRVRRFTGYANPAMASTRSTNRPTGPTRSSDPASYRTDYEYDDRGRVRRIVDSARGTDEYEYDDEGAGVKKTRTDRSLVRWRRSPGPRGADQPELLHEWEYEPDFRYVTSYTAPGGEVTEYDYDAEGNRVQTRLAEPGLVHDWTYDSWGEPLTHTWPDDGTGYRRLDAFTYHGPGPQEGLPETSVRDAAGGGLALTRTFTWTDSGYLLHLDDEEGNRWTTLRNQLDQVVRLLKPMVAAQGNVRYEFDVFYDLGDDLIELRVQNLDETGTPEANPATSTTFLYGPLHEVLRVTREVDGSTDVVTEYAYDGNLNVVRVDSDRSVQGVDPDAATEFQYDERDLLFRTTRAPLSVDASSTEYDYDANGNVVETRAGIEDGARTTNYEYDGYDRRTRTTDAMGNERLVTWDASSQPIELELMGERMDVPGSASNVSLRHVQLGYDGLARFTDITVAHLDGMGMPIGAGLATWQWTWAGLAGPATYTDPTSNTTTYDYDRASRLSQRVDPEGNTTQVAYDGLDRPVARIEAHAHDLGGMPTLYTWTWMYDELGRLDTAMTPGGETFEFEYDSRDDVRVATDPLDNVTRYEYDLLGRRTKTIRELTDTGTGMGTLVGDLSTFYDWTWPFGLAGVTNDKGYTTTLDYDSLGRLVSVDVPDGTTWLFEWDAHDDLVSRQDPNGTTVTLAYDALGRRTAETVMPGAGVSSDTTSTTTTYDGAGRPTCLDDDDTMVAREYDSLGRILSETSTVTGSGGPVIGTLSYGRNAAGDVTQLVLPGGRTLDYTYDGLHRVLTIEESAMALATNSWVGPRDRLERRTHDNGTQVDWTYDAALRPTRTLTSTGMSTVADRAATWTVGGLAQASRENALAGGSSFVNTVDSLGRLVESEETPAAGPMVTTTYTLDDQGNRTNVAGGPNPGSYTQDATTPDPADDQVDQYTSTPLDDRTYDANGNLLSRDPTGMTPADAFVYDYADQLVEYVDPLGLVTRYAYDSLGRRVRRVLDATGMSPEESLVFHVGGQQGEEVDGTGMTLATYVPADPSSRVTVDVEILTLDLRSVDPFHVDFLGEPGFEIFPETVAMRRGGTDHTFHPTPDGSVAGLTDPMGVLAERYEYGDFGEPRVFDGNGMSLGQSAQGNPFLYRGWPYDGETRTYYVGGIASDILKEPGGFEPEIGRPTTRGGLAGIGSSGEDGVAVRAGGLQARIGSSGLDGLSGGPWPMGLLRVPPRNIGLASQRRGTDPAASTPSWGGGGEQDWVDHLAPSTSRYSPRSTLDAQLPSHGRGLTSPWWGADLAASSASYSGQTDWIDHLAPSSARFGPNDDWIDHLAPSSLHYTGETGWVDHLAPSGSSYTGTDDGWVDHLGVSGARYTPSETDWIDHLAPSRSRYTTGASSTPSTSGPPRR